MNKLPQHEDNRRKVENRKNYLLERQAQYQYAYEYANTIAVVRKLPYREIPGLGYWLRGGLNLLRLIPSLPSLAVTYLRHLFGKPMESYQNYVFYPFSPPNPDLVNNFQQDLIFGLQRVIGVNPVVLRAVTSRHPLPEKLTESEIQRIFVEYIKEIDYATAIEQKRMYVLDYAVLDILQQNPGHIDGGRKQYTTTPIVVLFMQSDGMLRPIAIQLYQDSEFDNPIYTARDGNLWLVAKLFAQIADGNHHILYTHATRIHYVMEAIIMASRRQLYKSHPLSVLLNPHLQHTLNVNHQHTFLKDQKGRPGRFGELFAGDYEATTQCMANGMTSFNFRASAFPDDIASREVDNPDLFYPYRDDGMLLWNAIQGFIKEYVDVYYRSDADVSEDYEIQAWANDISAQDRGRIPGFPAKFESKQELAETLGHIIFLCTAFHSSIHFNQYKYPGFVPNMPHAAYVPPPTGKCTEMDEAGLLKFQPAFRAAYSQTWTYFQTNFTVNRIGQYPLRQFDPPACDVIKRFRKRLKEIEREIDQRNSKRVVTYDRMNPRSIPNGVTV
ncbi:lipoxygenase family protein [Nitrosomonas communis]|uniref:Arachidonate 15-lipoxygenase n=1 Tax=Nitrosomonas communis TaxID=44574 RepID=A0A1H2R146_9PROT|nr:lipoxygenase family protein [Nitrosomonas communis]SDW12399.1 arachidonate 15-lipoxygenase [Nitrosomonas communis]